MHTNYLLIYTTPTLYNMKPYSCFQAEMFIDDICTKNYIDQIGASQTKCCLNLDIVDQLYSG